MQSNGMGSDWRAPAWQNSLLGSAAGKLRMSVALSAPLPAPGVLPSNATSQAHPPHLSAAAHPKPPESDGAPSTVDGDFGEPQISGSAIANKLVV